MAVDIAAGSLLQPEPRDFPIQCGRKRGSAMVGKILQSGFGMLFVQHYRS